MARIAKFNDEYWINFEDHCLYFYRDRIIELQKRPLEVLEYLCNYPNCYKSVNDINNYIDEGCLSSEAIRGYISALRRSHPVFLEVIPKNRSGYMYIGEKITLLGSNNEQEDEPSCKYSLKEFLQKEAQIEADLLRAVMYCYCKWGTCTHDETPQNTNTCEGILALLSVKDKEKYSEVIEDAIEYLKAEVMDKGLKSKSLNEETVVPTAMYLYLTKKIQNKFDVNINKIASKLWSARTCNGWGIYVKRMEKFANIGCTYWAIKGLEGYANISEEVFQKYLRSLFKYENAYAYGVTINDVNPRVPSLYATSMMYIIYNHLSDSSKIIIGRLYDPERAIEYIVKNFDNPYLLTEQEGINGVEVDGKIAVHTVGWNHITVDYSLTALSIAFEKGCFSKEEMNEILFRVEKLVTDNIEKNEQIMFWSAPTMAIDKGNRGKLIFPTMHLIMGLSRIREAVELLCT